MKKLFGVCLTRASALLLRGIIACVSMCESYPLNSILHHRCKKVVLVEVIVAYQSLSPSAIGEHNQNRELSTDALVSASYAER